MICLVQEMDELYSLCVDSPFGCQILSAAKAYGLDRVFAQFWTDETAAYGKLDGVMRICGTISDAEEAKAFLYAVGAEQVVCSAENAQILNLNIAERGVILTKQLAESTAVGAEEVSPRKVYDVLHACDMVGDFEPFYLDLSHRLRHDCAVCTALNEADSMAAAAVAVFGAECALITAVAVRPELQRKGLGKAVMRKLEEKLSGRVYLLRAENENERFYASLGYMPCGTWCACVLE